MPGPRRSGDSWDRTGPGGVGVPADPPPQETGITGRTRAEPPVSIPANPRLDGSGTFPPTGRGHAAGRAEADMAAIRASQRARPPLPDPH